MWHQRKLLRIRGCGTPITVGDEVLVKKEMLFNPVRFCYIYSTARWVRLKYDLRNLKLQALTLTGGTLCRSYL